MVVFLFIMNDNNNDSNEEDEEKKDSKILPSEILEREHKKIVEELDSLKETKKEMVWLLKQVINAENKRKAAETAVPKKKLKL